MKHGTPIERHASHTYRLAILTHFKDMLELEICVKKTINIIEHGSEREITQKQD